MTADGHSDSPFGAARGGPTWRVASPEALQAAEEVARRVKNREAQIRRLFVARRDPDEPTPLARQLRGGRGGHVRMKLYLSLIWFAANPPYDVTYPARAWAQLLDLPDPESAGARRINDAFAWLAEHEFIRSIPRPGLPSRIELLHESGTGRPYEVPGAAWGKLPPDASAEERDLARYVRLPPQFWTNGWLPVLSGSAVAMLLVLLAEIGPNEPGEHEVWLSPDVALRRYDLSSDTRSAGFRELVDAGIVQVMRRTINPTAFDFRRMRNVYRYQPSAFMSAGKVMSKRSKREADATL